MVSRRSKIVQSIFGPGYVPENHSDQAQPRLLPADREFYFGGILNSLPRRLALALGSVAVRVKHDARISATDSRGASGHGHHCREREPNLGKPGLGAEVQAEKAAGNAHL